MMYLKNERKSDGSHASSHKESDRREQHFPILDQHNACRTQNLPHLPHLEGKRRQDHGYRGHCHCSGGNRRRQHDRVDQREENS